MESGRGIFPAASSQGLSLRAYNGRKKHTKVLSDRAKLDRFADLLADGYEPDAAAIMMGCVPDHGQTLLNRIRKRLGPQAR